MNKVNDSVLLLAVGLLNVAVALVIAGIRARSEAAQSALSSGDVLARMQEGNSPAQEYAGAISLEAS